MNPGAKQCCRKRSSQASSASAQQSSTANRVFCYGVCVYALRLAVTISGRIFTTLSRGRWRVRRLGRGFSRGQVLLGNLAGKFGDSHWNRNRQTSSVFGARYLVVFDGRMRDGYPKLCNEGRNPSYILMGDKHQNNETPLSPNYSDAGWTRMQRKYAEACITYARG
jgi:hypothetical protein